MLPVLFGLVAAMIFSFVAYAIYGLEGVMTLSWIDAVFWAFIFTGVAVATVNAIWKCLGCRLSKLTQNRMLAALLCSNATCDQ